MTLIGGKCEEGSTLMIVWGLQSSLWQAERIERANEKKRQGDNGRGNKKEGMKKRRKRMKRKASNQLDIIGGKDTDVALKLSFPPSAVFLFGESHNRPDIQSKISRVLRRVIVQNTSFGPRICVVIPSTRSSVFEPLRERKERKERKERSRKRPSGGCSALGDLGLMEEGPLVLPDGRRAFEEAMAAAIAETPPPVAPVTTGVLCWE